MLKVLLAEHGIKRDLLATLRQVQAWAERRAGEDADIARASLEAPGGFPERASQLVFVGQHSADFVEMTRRWAVWAARSYRAGPSARGLPDWDALREIAARAELTPPGCRPPAPARTI